MSDWPVSEVGPQFIDYLEELMNPEIVVFDLGKVLLDFDFSRAATRLSESSKASFEDLNALINQSPHLHAYEKGAMTTEAFIGQIITESGFDGTVGDFEEAFSDIFTERPNMIALNRRLRAGGSRPTSFRTPMTWRFGLSEIGMLSLRSLMTIHFRM